MLLAQIGGKVGGQKVDVGCLTVGESRFNGIELRGQRIKIAFGYFGHGGNHFGNRLFGGGTGVVICTVAKEKPVNIHVDFFVCTGIVEQNKTNTIDVVADSGQCVIRVGKGLA